jgi:SAM-dependent methyltransferase
VPITQLPTIPPEAYQTLREVEDSHWWFAGMEQITREMFARFNLLERASGAGAGLEILDAGCGTGRNLGFLGRYGKVTGLDCSAVALEYCRARGLERLVEGSVNALPFEEASFDLVTCFDVLVLAGVDQRAALAEMARVLRPGGSLFVRVAAYDWLRGRHDRQWSVAQRFERPQLRALLSQTGLCVRVASYVNCWLFPVALAKRLGERWFGDESASDLQLGARPGWGAQLARAVLASEASLAASGALPFGLSVVALAQKPAPPVE